MPVHRPDQAKANGWRSGFTQIQNLMYGIYFADLILGKISNVTRFDPRVEIFGFVDSLPSFVFGTSIDDNQLQVWFVEFRPLL